MEEISLNLAEPTLSVTESNSGGIKISVDSPKKSVNFGPGAEMLMNQNKSKASSPKADINIDDIGNLDSINLDAGPPEPKIKRPSFTDVTSNLFSGPKNNETVGIKLKIDEPPSIKHRSSILVLPLKLKLKLMTVLKPLMKFP